MVSTRFRSLVLCGVATSLTVGLLAGCSAKKNGEPTAAAGATTSLGRSSSSEVISAPSSSVAAEPAVLSVPVTGSTAVNPVKPIKVSVTGGTLTAVKLTTPTGAVVKGGLAADKASWLSSEVLGYGKTYKLTASATNADGTVTDKSSSFTTVKPNNLTMPYIQTAAGGAIAAGTTFGVGQVIRIHFDESVPNRKAAQTALSVKTVPAQLGAFNWLSDTDVYWRTKVYLKPGTKVTINARVYGKDLGSGLYGQADAATWFKVGDSHISIADDKTKLVKVYDNGKLVKTMPTSMGRDTSIPGDNGTQIDLRTNSGPHVVVGGETNINMNSASFGLSKGANAYKTIVPVGVRISYDGEYVHWADWSVWAQGNTDTSHGCLNVSPDNSWWFYRFSVPGDIVDVRNTGRPLQLWNSGYWTASWASWAAGTAK